MSVIAQRCDMSVDLYACVIEFHKAFDRINCRLFIEILKDIGLDGRDIQIIAKSY